MVISEKPLLSVYFMAFFLLGPVALMSIVTAIMVESSLRTVNEDTEAKKVWKDMKREAMRPRLREMFMGFDTNGNSEIDLQEFLNAPEDLKETVGTIVDMDQFEEVFSLLDYDKSGSVDIDEFIDGLIRSTGEKPSELLALMKMGRTAINLLDDVLAALKS